MAQMLQILFELALAFCTSVVKATAKVLVKKFFDNKQKATLTSNKRNKGSKSGDD